MGGIVITAILAFGSLNLSPVRTQDLGSGIAGFADWAEQLIAESTGKNGVAIIEITDAARKIW